MKQILWRIECWYRGWVWPPKLMPNRERFFEVLNRETGNIMLASRWREAEAPQLCGWPKLKARIKKGLAVKPDKKG